MAEYGRLIDGTVLEFERLLPGPIERVWEYFVNPDLRQKWFCAGKTDDHAGGTLTLSFDHTRISSAPPPKKYADDQGGDFDCEILVYEPPHRLDFSWPSEQGTPGLKAPSSSMARPLVGMPISTCWKTTFMAARSPISGRSTPRWKMSTQGGLASLRSGHLSTGPHLAVHHRNRPCDDSRARVTLTDHVVHDSHP